MSLQTAGSVGSSVLALFAAEIVDLVAFTHAGHWCVRAFGFGGCAGGRIVGIGAAFAAGLRGDRGMFLGGTCTNGAFFDRAYFATLLRLRNPWSLRHLPNGGGRRAPRSVPENPGTDRPTAKANPGDGMNGGNPR